MSPDLDRLREQLERLQPILDELELELVDDPKWSEPSSTSYLTDADRANPDIMSNVEAMAATNELVAWFGRDSEGFVGLWRGPSMRPLESAPVVRLDTEGQYRLRAGSIPDYLAVEPYGDDLSARREVLIAAGFAVSDSPDAVYAKLDAISDKPNLHRHALYNEARADRGLPPIAPPPR